MPRISSREFASLLLALALFASASSGVLADSEPLPRFVGTAVPQDALLEDLASSESWQFKPVGRNSLVLRMRTRSRVTAGLKVQAHDSELGHRAEIAAYRVSRLLYLDNVPPTVSRQATRQEIKNRFHKDRRGRWPAVHRTIQWDESGSVDGAASYWVKGARRGFERKRATWKQWLAIDGTIPTGKESLARDLSTMAVFDFLVANWDRYSGSNLLIDVDRQRAIMINNHRTFSGTDEARYVQGLEDLIETERFSRSVIEHLLRLDRTAIQDELASDPSHTDAPLLSEAQLAELMDRRATILSHVSTLIEAHGRAQVLFFP